MTLPLFPDRRERIHGWQYLGFQLVFLGNLLVLAFRLLKIVPDAILINGLYFLINFVAVLCIFRRFWQETFKGALQSPGKILLFALAGFGANRVLGTVVGMIIVSIDPSFANVNDQNIALMGQENFAVMALGAVLLAPVAEEVLYRGVVFGSLYGRSKVLAYTVSVLLFALVHVSEYIGHVPIGTLALCFLQYVPAGLVLAASYQLSGSVVSPILIHMAVNAVSIAFMR